MNDENKYLLQITILTLELYDNDNDCPARHPHIPVFNAALESLWRLCQLGKLTNMLHFNLTLDRYTSSCDESDQRLERLERLKSHQVN